MKKSNKFGVISIVVLLGAIVLGYYLVRMYKTSDMGSAGSMDSKKAYCKCYCSDLCGPRDNKKPTDTPFVDPETGICFCQQRDKDNYLPNKCNLKEHTPFESCCDQQS